jgi:hypothetical protein
MLFAARDGYEKLPTASATHRLDSPKRSTASTRAIPDEISLTVVEILGEPTTETNKDH